MASDSAFKQVGSAETFPDFELPELPYAYDALEPVIDSKTMNIHHTKHHQGYVTNLNKALEGHAELAGHSLDDLLRKLNDLPESIRTAVRNHGGGHANHNLFWRVMRSPRDVNTPQGKLAEAIASTFDGFEKFKEVFTKAAIGQFGSGWAWLVKADDGLSVVATANQDSPITNGKQPLLGIDVWEHAYYLNYQNRRADYVDAWWRVVNWEEVANNFAA
ncbi:MAG TPA: superoxide dismutase [Pirellulaceae bacterium]|nr:superoxide dismutase [Pirellulaceae bacterium]HMO90604.1 superoxide dismutase [Pirellulaceae bacterium]HMP67817.1 superoxide dismutase [Pirellulaceae bacterium]